MHCGCGCRVDFECNRISEAELCATFFKDGRPVDREGLRAMMVRARAETANTQLGANAGMLYKGGGQRLVCGLSTCNAITGQLL